MVDVDEVQIKILIRANVGNLNSELCLWKRQSLDAKSGYTVHRSSILPFHPIMCINQRYSTRRVVIYEVMNYDIAENFF